MSDHDRYEEPFGARLMQETESVGMAENAPAEAALSRQTVTWNQGEDTQADD